MACKREGVLLAGFSAACPPSPCLLTASASRAVGSGIISRGPCCRQWDRPARGWLGSTTAAPIINHPYTAPCRYPNKTKRLDIPEEDAFFLDGLHPSNHGSL